MNEVKDRMQWLKDGIINQFKNAINNRIVFYNTPECDIIIDEIKEEENIIRVFLAEAYISNLDDRQYTILFCKNAFPADVLEISSNNNDNSNTLVILYYDENMQENKWEVTCRYNEYFKLSEVDDWVYEITIESLPVWLSQHDNLTSLFNIFPVVETKDHTNIYNGEITYTTDIYAYLNPASIERTHIKRIQSSIYSNLAKHTAAVQLIRSQLKDLNTIALAPGAVINFRFNNIQDCNDLLLRIDDIQGDILKCTDISSYNSTISISIATLAEQSLDIIYCTEIIYSYSLKNNGEVFILYSIDMDTMTADEVIFLTESVYIILDAMSSFDNLDFDALYNLVNRIYIGETIDINKNRIYKLVKQVQCKLASAVDRIGKIGKYLYGGVIRVYDQDQHILKRYNVDIIIQSMGKILESIQIIEKDN